MVTGIWQCANIVILPRSIHIICPKRKLRSSWRPPKAHVPRENTSQHSNTSATNETGHWKDQFHVKSTRWKSSRLKKCADRSHRRGITSHEGHRRKREKAERTNSGTCLASAMICTSTQQESGGKGRKPLPKFSFQFASSLECC